MVVSGCMWLAQIKDVSPLRMCPLEGKRHSGCTATGNSDLAQTKLEILPRRTERMASKLMQSRFAMRPNCCVVPYSAELPFLATLFSQ